MSGGVDSCACAILLKEKGYEVTALYFDTTKNEGAGKKRAEFAAQKLGINFIYKNLTEEFEEKIIQPFINEYKIGRTPIPCIFCNPLIKWAVLKQVADEIGAEYLATGHYARIEEKDGIYYVKKAFNERKDQSYMLARLGQDILSRAIFPLGEIESKEQTREIVSSLDLEFSKEKESQDICFIENNYVDFLADRNVTTIQGNYLDSEGKVLAPTEKGIHCFTIGQRKGLGIALGAPAYVTKINSDTGDITLSTNEADLFKDNVLIDNIVWNGARADGEFTVKLRYAAKPAKATITNRGKYAILSFDEPQRAPTPGQAAVIYFNDFVVGCGIIC